jgi:hypothetical protein
VLPSPDGTRGRFEILSELAILTSDILGSESSTTQVDNTTPVAETARPHPAVIDGLEDGHVGEG